MVQSSDMPSTSDEEELKPKRAPRKRATSTAAKKAAPKKPRKVAAKKAAPRKKVAPVVEEPENTEDEQATAVPEVTRKAPTTFSTAKPKRRFPRHSVIVGVILLIGVGASAAVGFSDVGQINVNEVIEARNQRVLNNSTDERDDVVNSVSVPVQNTNNQNQVDGGLVGIGDTTPPPAPAATTTASTTDTTASSTEPVATSTQEVVEPEPVATSTEPTPEVVE